MDGDGHYAFSSANAGNVSCVGNFDENGLNVNNWNGNRNDNVGVGASRNFFLSYEKYPPEWRIFL
ncbi:MAG: hypothetical protein A3G02_00265 [Candidatus Yanofskybacteria bacterium RIFCSPLOWO2_12_FULL_44_13b]|uniref:Uncharacterized protein n=1 Tax=Candidatus Yanofskybacteria bacterium RIFCSPLOWO2_02_FULL_44_18 TaxID=1802705 RepID=A0A1F8H0S5_9BACT|nr:MAG: hypothetical protein A2657_01110 [Candidatus Yanofskybacteria bacterium RIFCSPHIGHO2_01_FULL_44_110b]OGN15180.1 MAG: hypothetical protein A3C01_01935 [Candidatus Yanofskybacteria bacterium RIFCSPHIGHO2_02_FULL_44_36b]OGN18458.1 MAG: hypothetical protein A3F50_01525 [Candidatus Yanofskybacteria bacterium RIFCSPHIGHO2_12_FULL_44_29b]OGN26608.1 MAG: hypothetical protein A3B12_01265 [Candidatus Yanofskybacteria bacterium RIFCSPLOWO2_01_FULL_44_88]OGN31285.1 MAG: hypothetical protein A3I96_0